MIKWLVQDTSRTLYAVNDEFNALKKLNYEIVPFGVIPFTDTITGLDDIKSTDTVIIRAGTKIVGLLGEMKSDNISPEVMKVLNNGISHSVKNFDQAYYSNLDLPLLNSNPLILDLKKDLYASFSTDKFVKPSSDLKAFTAGVMNAGTVLKNFIESHYYRSNYADETVLVHDVVEINAEYRFICIEDKVIEGSRYRDNNQLIVNNSIPKSVLDCANEYVKLYNPSDIFTMDLAETPMGIKIVEYNCWNGSGLYAMDIPKLFSTVQEYYSKFKMIGV